MAGELNGRRVAILATDGVELVEVTQPREAVEKAGALADVSADDYDALILPGGTVNPDGLRVDKDAVAFVQAFFQAGKPVDEEVVCDEGLVTSRNPDDLDVLCAKIVEESTEGKHPVHDDGAIA